MAKKKLPKCFISYCHEEADFPTIDCFQDEIERISRGSFEVLRDKSNVDIGDRISEHELEIDNSDIIIILCTPQYKNKILNRSPGGVYREYGKIITKYKNYINSIKHGKAVRTFSLIPILFSGTHASSIMEDVTDNLYLDFTQFRTIQDNRNDYIVPDFVKTSHVEKFKQIKSKFNNVKTGLDKSFLDNYSYWLDMLFAQEKHEILRKKYKFANKEEMLNELFVKTTSYNRVIDGEKFILVGRKGSGKSTIVDHFHRGNIDKYKTPIQIIIDNFDLGFLYNFIFTSDNSRDIFEVVKIENYFEAVWKIYIFYQCIYTLNNEEDAGNTLVNLDPYLDDLASIKPLDELKWGQFVGVCEQVSRHIDDVIKDADAGKYFYQQIANKVSIDTIVEEVMGKTTTDALSGAIELCHRKFIFALDGFDQHFEDFRVNNLGSSQSEEEKFERIAFEIAWLKGLLRTTIECRAADKVLKDKVDFCITIPQDRYMEVRQSERDDYRYRSITANLQWSAVELAILIRKRLEGFSAYVTSKTYSPIERLNEILSCDDIDIPTRIKMSVDGNVLTTSLFKYLLRHTFWRPRDILFYVAAIMANKKTAANKTLLDEGLIKEIVSRTTYDVIETEFIKEYQNNIINIKNIIQLFEGKNIILTFEEIEVILNQIPFSVNAGSIQVDEIIQKLDYLYNIGFVGVELDERQSRDRKHCKDMFIFSDGLKKYLSIGDKKKKEQNYVLHPLFIEYLNLNTNAGRIICEYSDQYILNNDILNE